MKKRMLTTLAILVLGSVSALWSTGQARQRDYNDNYYNYHYGRHQGYRLSNYNRVVVPAGTAMNVRLDTKISTDETQSGETWSGTVTQSVIADNRVVIPAGTPVEGVVTSSVQGTHNNRPSLELAVRRASVDGRMSSVNAVTEPIVAGSDRAKKIGVIAGGAAAGALLGHAIAKGSHGALIGGVLGGAAGYGLSRNALRTMQLKPGTLLTFTTRSDVLAYR
jgi:hypothetical protein